MKSLLFWLAIVVFAGVCRAIPVAELLVRSPRADQDLSVSISIRSEGCDDPGITEDTCGLAYIYVNGKDKSHHIRGHNVVVVDAVTGEVLRAAGFDTHSGEKAAGENLKYFLNNIKGEDKFVLVAIQDEGSKYVAPAIEALKRVGATDPILTDYRGSFALIGYSGVVKPPWVEQGQANRKEGPTELSKTIPLSPEHHIGIHLRSEGCNDPTKTPETCGIAYMFVDGIARSPRFRGHNVVVLEAKTGAVLEAEAFDTHGQESAGENLKLYLNAIRGDKIVLVTIQDEGSKYVKNAEDALKRLGATDPILTDYRGSFCLVGYAGDTKPSWITQQQHNGGEGPAEISLQIPYPPGPAVGIRLRSEGCNDIDKKPETCGIAYIYVDGIDESPQGRGHNVVVVDAATGDVLDAKAFDTHGDANAGKNLTDFLNSITGEKIVLVTIQDEGSKYITDAEDALKRLGAKDPILKDYRGSLALVGYAGDATPSWISLVQRNSGEGPSEISVRIPLSPVPVNGGWSDFGAWSECSVTCGGGIKERTRSCTNPAPEHGGLYCVGDSKEEETCNTQACKVNGGFTEWSEYSACSKTCGKDAVKTRTRTCTNPPPSGGGKGCGKRTEQKVKCKLPKCKGY